MVLEDRVPIEMSRDAANLDFDVLFESRRRNEILVRGLLGRMICDGALDPVSATALTEIAGGVAVRHVFPRRYVIDRGGDPDSILNLMIIAATAAKRYGEQLPGVFLQGENPWDRRALESQHCDVATLERDAYGDFIASRAKAIFTMVQRATVEPR